VHQLPIGLLAVLGFLVGLIASFWVAGIFGFPAPLFWASIVTAFILGVFLLQKPKIFLVLTFLYYTTFLNGVLFGTIYVPLPFARLLDELLLAVPLAYLVMRAINRDLPRGATFFPLLYVLLAWISYKANGVPKLPWFRTVLSFAKFYVYWYFVRALGPWSYAEKKRWFWGLYIFAVAQFFMNVIWQQNVVLTKHPDFSVGTLGNAHLVGYVSACSLFWVIAWFFSEGLAASLGRRLTVFLGMVLITYNFIFLTDTKHALVIFPFVAWPLFFHQSISARYRLGLALGLMLFLVLSSWYIAYGPYTMRAPVADYIQMLRWSGKGYLYKIILKELPRGNPIFFLLGAGPGNFCSTGAIYGFTPLAVKYVIPYIVQGLRSGGGAAEASVLGSPTSSLLVLLGEFGWLGAINYLGFWIWTIFRMWKLARQSPKFDWDTGQRLALVCVLSFLLVLATLSDLFAFAQIVMPIWTMVALYWEDPRTTAV
jgi:hypothetical protein